VLVWYPEPPPEPASAPAEPAPAPPRPTSVPTSRPPGSYRPRAAAWIPGGREFDGLRRLWGKWCGKGEEAGNE
jgi:hypothetical protein